MATDLSNYPNIIVNSSSSPSVISKEFVSQIKDTNDTILWQKAEKGYCTIWKPSISNTETITVREGTGAFIKTIPVIDLVIQNPSYTVDLDIKLKYSVKFYHGTTTLYRRDTNQTTTINNQSSDEITISLSNIDLRRYKSVGLDLFEIKTESASTEYASINFYYKGDIVKDGITHKWAINYSAGAGGQYVGVTPGVISVQILSVTQSMNMPYRRLEYIKFSGNEYVEENFNLAAKNRKMVLEYTCDQFVANASLLAQWDNTVAANQRRLYIARCNNTSGQAIWYIGGKYGLYDNMSLNTKYKSTVTYTNASANTLTYDLKNSLGTTLASGTLTETSTSIPTIDSKAALGTTKLKDANGNISYGGYWNGKLYKFEKYVASTNTLQNNQFPCQRKSDGVCGVYDTVTQMFFPMTGTNITDAAAGPVVDEYWNLQA